MDCESCVYYMYDEYEDCYICTVNMDEDEAVRLFSGNTACPYYRREDEYGIVRKQN